MKILVTGGAGFIASHVVDAYIEAGHQVAVVDNLSTGRRDNLNNQAVFYEMPIQSESLERCFKEFQPDIVNHHAAHIDLRKSVDDPMFDAESNIMGTLNLLKNAVKYSTRKIIFASTGGAIYGDPELNPVAESSDPTPLSPYGAGKLASEHYLRIWKHLFNLDYTIFRYPNVYGPRQDPKGEAGVVAIFSLMMLRGETPCIFGDGSKTRDYLFVEDLVRANILALTEGSGETLNLGWGREISDQLVFDTVRDAVQFDQQPRYEPVRAGEVYRIALDAKRADKVLQWVPEVPFEQGVEKTVRFYREKEKNY